MPLYEYRCSACAKTTDIRHGFDEVNTQACPHCGGALVRAFGVGGIMFKGSGFYVNDSRGAKSSTSTSSASPAAAPADAASPAPAAPAAPATPAPGPAPSSPGGAT